jgi:hypothetical protein
MSGTEPLSKWIVPWIVAPAATTPTGNISYAVATEQLSNFPLPSGGRAFCRQAPAHSLPSLSAFRLSRFRVRMAMPPIKVRDSRRDTPQTVIKKLRYLITVSRAAALPVAGNARRDSGPHELLAKASANCPDPQPAAPERIWCLAPDSGARHTLPAGPRPPCNSQFTRTWSAPRRNRLHCTPHIHIRHWRA